MQKQEHRLLVVRAEERDVDRMCELLGGLFAIEQDFTVSRERQAAGLRLLLDRTRDAAAFVARDADDRVVGMVTGQLVASTAEGALSVWIEDVVVDETSRGRGIGRALLQAVLTWAKDAGATRAQLLVDTDNSLAEGFYERLGWRKTQLAARQIFLTAVNADERRLI